MPPMGAGGKTPIPKPTARVGADRQRERVNGLHRIKLLSGALDEQGLAGNFDLPSIRRLPDKRRARG